MRSLIFAAVAALALTSVSPALADSSSPVIWNKDHTYGLDAKGKCHDAHGKFVASSMCHAAAPKHCVKGKACGNTCIKATDVCHKP
jgi:hypothetical protein